MPYLVAPFMSFLVYTSPLAYYSILKSWQSSQRVHVVPPSAQPEKLDIPTLFLRRYLLKKTSRPSGAIIATLSLEPFPVHYRPRSDPLSLLLRPNFLLLPELSLSGIDHILLEPTHSIPGLPGSIAAMHKDTWVLDFTDNGASKGVVMSQSRMREIQLVIDPDTSMREFGMTVEGVYRSWIHLLVRDSLHSRWLRNFLSCGYLSLRSLIVHSSNYLMQLCPLSPAPFNPAERFVTEYVRVCIILELSE